MHRRAHVGAGFLLMLMLASSAIRAAADPIVEIRFEGNRKTKPETLLREMLVQVGDPADPEQIERSRQAIMDLELFKSVQVDLKPDPAGGGRILTITVAEKRYLFVLPVLGRSADGDITYGLQGRVDNLWGRDHRFSIEVKRKNLSSDADTDDERTVQTDYHYPRIRNGPWTLDVRLRDQRARLEEDRDGVTGEFDRTTDRFEFLTSRWRNNRGASRGWRYSAGLSYEDFRFEFVQGDPTLFFDTTELGLLTRIDYVDVRNFEFNRSGRDFGIALDGFAEALGAAKNRLVGSIRYRAYNPVTHRRYTNLNYQLQAGLATVSLFGDPTYDIAGGDTLRGYSRGIIEGNAYLLANVEFLTPISKLDALRGVVFADAGNAFRGAGNTLGNIKTAAGLGLRWKIRSFVRVDLRLDAAKGFGADGETRFYAGTDATF